MSFTDGVIIIVGKDSFQVSSINLKFIEVIACNLKLILYCLLFFVSWEPLMKIHFSILCSYFQVYIDGLEMRFTGTREIIEGINFIGKINEISPLTTRL